MESTFLRIWTFPRMADCLRLLTLWHPGFYWVTRLGSFLLLLLLLWWLVFPLFPYHTFFDILSGDLHIWSSSQWPSSRCCSQYILPQLLPDTYLFLSLWLLYLVYCEVCVYLLLSGNPTLLLLAHSLLLNLVCAHTRILYPPWFHSVCICLDIFKQLLDCAC